MNRTKALLIGGGALLGLILLGVLARGPQDESDKLSWDTVTRGDIRETLTASGEIRAKTQINLGSMVVGEIKERYVEDGDPVKKGQLLVKIDPVQAEQQLQRGAAALDAARKDADRLEAAKARALETFQRTEALFKQGLVSDEEFRQQCLAKESAELSAASAKANVVQSEASYRALQDSLSKTTLRAPFDGVVTGLKAEKGEMAIPGVSNLPGAVLMVISDMSQIMAQIKVNESEVVRLKKGQIAQVTVEPLPGRVFQGRVEEVATAAEKTGTDANLYMVKVYLDMSSKDIQQLRPGMSARGVILTNEAKGVLRVPLQAVLEREGNLEEAQAKGLLAPPSRSIVMVVKGAHAVETPLTVGIANTNWFEVKEGLAEGDKVITGPTRKLKDLKDHAPVKLRPKSDSQLEEERKAKEKRK
jgi:HlyD family secretion protein